MQANTASGANRTVNFHNFSVENRDSISVRNGRFVGDDGFVVPKDFAEFHERFPEYVRNWGRWQRRRDSDLRPNKALRGESSTHCPSPETCRLTPKGNGTTHALWMMSSATRTRFTCEGLPMLPKNGIKIELLSASSWILYAATIRETCSRWKGLP